MTVRTLPIGAILAAFLMGCAEGVSDESASDFFSTIDEVETIPVSLAVETFDVKAFGYDGALTQARDETWNGSLAVKILTPVGEYRRSLRWTQQEIVYDYSSFESAAHFDSVVDAMSPAQDAAIVFLAPPGTFGSSGSAEMIYHESSAAVLSSAIDTLKQQTGASRLTLAGASVSGNLVAHILARRSDVDCAIIASAPLDLLAFRAFNHAHRRAYEDEQVSSPMDAVDEIRTAAGQQIRLGFSATDTIVPPRYQRPFYDALTNTGATVTISEAQTSDPSGHALVAWESRQFTDCN